MTNIKVRDLPDTSTLSADNQLMVLTDDANNTVKNITVSNFTQEMVSTDADNAITMGTDGKFYTPIQLTENANISLSNLDATGEAKFANPNLSNLTATGLSKFVQRIGDTMSGNLIIDKSEPTLFLDNADVTLGTAPSSHKYNTIQFRDVNEQELGNIHHARYDNGATRTMLYCKNSDGTNGLSLEVGYTANGTPVSAAPACSLDGSILTTVAHDYSQTDKYLKLGNGIMFQWGYAEEINSSGETITLPQPFYDAYYAIYLGRGSLSPGLAENPYWANRTTTSFKLFCNRTESRNAFWLAIGTY